MSQSKIAELHGIRPAQVAGLVRRWDLRRPRNFEREGLTRELLENAYTRDRMSVLAIEERFGVPRQAITAALEHHGIELRSRADAISRGLGEILSPGILRRASPTERQRRRLPRSGHHGNKSVEAYLVRHGLKQPKGLDPRFNAR